MRTLTQVWVLFVALTILLLVAGFQLGGRLGLFIAFLLGLVFLYLILKKGLWIFSKHFKFQQAVGSDPLGLLKILDELKYQYGFQEIRLFYSEQKTTPLAWQENSNCGSFLLYKELPETLNPQEKVLLGHLLLSHLKTRSSFKTRFFSILDQSFGWLRFIVSPILSFLSFLTGYSRSILNADYSAMKNAQVSDYEFGYFLNKLHGLRFHKSIKITGAEFFSILTPASRTKWQTFGQPPIKQRLTTTMGFTL